jgi:glycosyltransferase involved in cell wall biosynthesis
MIESQPRVSVIIPTYNSGHTICVAVESVLAQTYQDVETIVIDDGSTDDTRLQLERYAGKIEYHYQCNQERSVARNHGIRLARGRYIAFLDADDWWLPDKLERQIAHVEKHPDLGMVYSWVNVVNEAGEELRILGNERPSSEATGVKLIEWFLLGNSIPTLSVVVRRECLDKVGSFDVSITYIEDWDLWMRIASKYPVGFVAKPLACYQVRHSYLPAVFARHQLQDKRLYVIEKALTARPDIKAEIREYARLRAYWYSALIDFGVKDIAAAQSRIEQIRFEISDFVNKTSQLEADLVAFAFSLYDDFTPEAEAIAFIEFVLANLPPELAILTSRGRQMKSILLGGYAFQARAQGHNSRARAFMKRAVALNPAFILNIGVLTTCLAGTWADKRNVSRIVRQRER